MKAHICKSVIERLLAQLPTTAFRGVRRQVKSPVCYRLTTCPGDVDETLRLATLLINQKLYGRVGTGIYKPLAVFFQTNLMGGVHVAAHLRMVAPLQDLFKV